MNRSFKWKIPLIVVIAGFAFWKAYPLQEKINLGLDLQGGIHVVLKVDTSGLDEKAKKDAPERALEIISNRVNQFGVSEPVIHRQGVDEIVVQLPGVTDRERALELIGRTALLEFNLVSDDPQKLKDALDGKVVTGYELKELNKEKLLVAKKAALTGEYLVDASVEYSQQTFGQPYVSLEFDSKGAGAFDKITGDNVGRRLAIVLDGNVHSAPRINERISGGRAQISGSFSQEEANDLAIVLRAGALPAPIIIEEERTVGPSLGRDSIRKGVRSVLIGGIAVVAFMAAYYLFAGLVANFTLLLNLIIIMGALAYFKATLTLPGIAGIVLTIGMAVDANVLIFERIREELRLGKHLLSAITSGYKKAFLTILDSNLTTLITAIILFQFGTGPVKGFAMTLSIGILASMFTALVVTRVILELAASRFNMKSLPMLQLIKDPKIDFIGKRKIAYFLSLLLIIFGITSFFIKGQKNFGIDFTGGTIEQLRFEEPVDLAKMRSALFEIGLGDAPLQQFGNNKEVIVRTYAEKPDMITDKLKEVFGNDSFEVLRIEKVGPLVGSALRHKAFLALIYSMIGICAYVSFRFHFKYAIAAILALLHDVLICVGAVSITGREFSLPVIAALLTIVGYSINDTIVVFDRIREDLKLMRKDDFKTVLNASINQTLSRTVITSLTTLLVVIALFLFGGNVINDFAFVLLVGIIVGTYSSIFVASPILMDWRDKR